jgi:hypothetical protein
MHATERQIVNDLVERHRTHVYRACAVGKRDASSLACAANLELQGA